MGNDREDDVVIRQRGTGAVAGDDVTEDGHLSAGLDVTFRADAAHLILPLDRHHGNVTALPNVVEDLSAAWGRGWSETPPIAFLLRNLHPDRWVRFHSLPESKRRAETQAERAEILSRHHAVLDALGPSARLLVIFPRFAHDCCGSCDVAIPGASYWQPVEDPDWFDEPMPLYVSALAYPSIEFDGVLRGAADWELAHVIIGPEDLRWLYHPYDGGADVIAATTRQRDQLATEFRTWLSPYPGGL